MGIGFPFVTQKLGAKFTSRINESNTPKLTPDEHIEIEDTTNLWRGIEAVGGKLYLTNKKLVFKPHKLNIQKGQINIHYNNITEIRKRKTAKVIDNGIQIKTHDGNEFNFVINEREKWIEKLNDKIK
ncbi:hypothetical protein HCO57_01700 [Croceivirga sp. JEA036]|nr:hypothetical protein [Croceivirga sp. JEA036]